MGIYDSDPAYAEKLSERLSARNDFPFAVLVFFEREELIAYTEGHHLQLLIVAEALAEEEILTLQADRILLLSEEKNGKNTNDTNAPGRVWRYQSVTGFVSAVMELFQAERSIGITDESVRILGIFTPDALLDRDRIVREILRERQRPEDYGEKSLLITLASFSDLAPYEEADQYDISDAYYFWKQNTLKDHMEELIRKGENFDYIPGVFFPEDLLVISRDQIRVFLKDLAELSGRKAVFIDFALFGNDVSLIRSLCSEQIMPFYEQNESRLRLRCYENYVCRSGNGDWLRNIVPYPLPGIAGEK